jgi:hypothetical protein
MKKTRIYLPFDYVHDSMWSFGNILIPIPFTKKWIGLFKKGFKIVNLSSFHNCTASGVY